MPLRPLKINNNYLRERYTNYDVISTSNQKTWTVLRSHEEAGGLAVLNPEDGPHDVHRPGRARPRTRPRPGLGPALTTQVLTVQQLVGRLKMGFNKLLDEMHFFHFDNIKDQRNYLI